MTETRLPLELSLRYDHSLGELAPYFNALGKGRAMARRCVACGHVWFPPHASCPRDSRPCEWLELDGTGTIVSVSKIRSRLPFAETDQDHVFALVNMDGADNAAFARLGTSARNATPGIRVRLVASYGEKGHPAQSAIFECLEEET